MMEFKRRSRWNYPHPWWRRLLAGWPFLLWLGMIALVVMLYYQSEEFGGLFGVVYTEAEPIAPLETARIISIDVTLGQRVKAGDVICRMDTSLLDANRSMDEAQVLTEAQETLARSQQDALQTLRQFETQVKAAEAALEEGRINQQRDTAELEQLTQEQARRDELLRKQLINEQVANELRPQLAALKAAVEGYPALLAVHERTLSNADALLQQWRQWLALSDGETAPDAIARKLSAHTGNLQSIRALHDAERKAYTLRASRDGLVSRIYMEPGDVVNAGTPVVRIVAERSSQIVGYLPEVRVAAIKPGQEASVRSHSSPGGSVKAVVHSVSPEIQQLPGRLNPFGGQPRGRRILLTIPGDHSFLPGESVRIQVSRNYWFAPILRAIGLSHQ